MAKNNIKTMFSLIKQVFVALLSFSRSLTTKCVSLNNEPCMIRPFLIDLNPVELKYYPFVINIGKCSGKKYPFMSNNH